MNAYKDFFKSEKIGLMRENRMVSAFGVPCHLESKDLSLTVRRH